MQGSSNASGESSATTSQEGVPTDKETRLTGIYDLVALLTHKGRSVESGHYVAWVKQESGQFPGIVNSSGRKTMLNCLCLEEVIGTWHTYACTRLVLFLCNLDMYFDFVLHQTPSFFVY
ncbi:hypothetical protein CRYUN_Cryun32bG0084400 [Craigia yunnanensis]